MTTSVHNTERIEQNYPLRVAFNLSAGFLKENKKESSHEIQEKTIKS